MTLRRSDAGQLGSTYTVWRSVAVGFSCTVMGVNGNSPALLPPNKACIARAIFDACEVDIVAVQATCNQLYPSPPPAHEPRGISRP